MTTRRPAPDPTQKRRRGTSLVGEPQEIASPPTPERARLTKARQERLVGRLIDECSADPTFADRVRGELRRFEPRRDRVVADMITTLQERGVKAGQIVATLKDALRVSERTAWRFYGGRKPR